MELHAFGYDVCSRLVSSGREDGAGERFPSTRTTNATVIKVLWLSWCDALTAYQNALGEWSIEYSGASLTPRQISHLTTSHAIKGAITDREIAIDFFGTSMHHGLRGYVVYDSDGEKSNTVALFATDLEMEMGAPEVEVSCIAGNKKIRAVRMVSDGGVLVCIVAQEEAGEGQIIALKDVAELRACLGDTSLFSRSDRPIASFEPLQWCTNSTTGTIVDQSNVIYTAAWDPRYPKSLGRSYEGTTEFEMVPYFSESRITKIASGGYMSAAISSEGELFLWGQANPGSEGELSVLKERVSSADKQGEPMATSISADGDQDEMVKCLRVLIEGEEAFAYDVAVGHGHILVAAEVQTVRSITKRVVFGAGDNGKAQLGLTSQKQYAKDFEEVVALRGLKIEQIVASAWTTLVVTRKE